MFFDVQINERLGITTSIAFQLKPVPLWQDQFRDCVTWDKQDHHTHHQT